MTRLRAVLLGAGKSGRLFHEALAQVPGVEIVGVTSRDGSSAALLTQGTTALAMDGSSSWLDLGPDIVVVATPHSRHVDQIRAALSFGGTVICDKPLALEASSLDDIARIASDTGRTVYCSMVQRCSPHVLRCRDYVHARIAQLRSIQITQHLRRDDPYYRTWKGDPGVAGGGVIVNQAIHALDLALFVTGLKFDLMGAAALGRDGILVETSAVAMFRAGSATVNLAVTTDSASNERQCIRLCFENETVLIVGNEVVSWAAVPSTADDAAVRAVEALSLAPDGYGPGYIGAVRDIVEVHISGRESRYDLGLAGVEQTHRLIYQIYEELSK